MSLRLAIFDCDGTLIDSQANICTAMEEAFGEAGLVPPDRAAIRRIVGLSLPEAMAVLAPGADADRLAETYKACFHRMRRQGRVEEQLYEGIPAMLDRMEAEGWLLGVATGKSDRGLRLVLEHHGLFDRFVTLQTADRHPSKPHPGMIHQALADAGTEPAQAVMVGDTSFDIAMAHNAGVRALGVAWGYHAPAELLAEGADAVARHPSDIPALALGEVA